MDTARISELLQPFLTPCHSERSEESTVLASGQLNNISTYIDILLRWNARINLTAVRQPEGIVTRHFGESLFAARHLFPCGGPVQTHVGADAPVRPDNDQQPPTNIRVLDVGSGAGFPGLPIKIWAPHIQLTLIESNHKKAMFLREAIRTLTLTNVNVFPARAEDYAAAPANVVTLRAVERFEKALPVAARLVATAGHLALLIGASQLAAVSGLTLGFDWADPIPVPLSSSRILLIGTKEPV
jgi:16S rRNA (guanine527-N7)-methyltransferase